MADVPPTELSGRPALPGWIPRAFRDWVPVRLIGQGGCGYVVEAVWSNPLGRRPAHLPERAAVKASLPGNPVLASLMLNEAQALRDLDHPGLVRVLEAFLDDTHESAVVVMELAEGDLASHLQVQGPLGAADARAVALEIAEALAYLHEHGRIHNDLKVGNVLRVDGRWKLSDFGLALSTDGRTHGYAESTNAWLRPPESIEVDDSGNVPYRVRPTWDTWAFGLFLHELLTGSDPRPGRSPEQRFLASIRGPVELADDLPPDLLPVLRACLAKDPADRARDGAAVVDLLRPPVHRAPGWRGIYGLSATTGPTNNPIVAIETERTTHVRAQRPGASWGPWATPRGLYDDPLVAPHGIWIEWTDGALRVQAWHRRSGEEVPGIAPCSRETQWSPSQRAAYGVSTPPDVDLGGIPVPIIWWLRSSCILGVSDDTRDLNGGRVVAGQIGTVPEACPSCRTPVGRGPRCESCGGQVVADVALRVLRRDVEVLGRRHGSEDPEGEVVTQLDRPLFDLSVAVNRWNAPEVWAIDPDGVLRHWWRGAAGWDGRVHEDVDAQRAVVLGGGFGQLDLLVLHGDGSVGQWHQERNGEWTRSDLPGGAVLLARDPADPPRPPFDAVRLPDGRIEVFGIDEDGAVRHCWQEDGGGWSAWATFWERSWTPRELTFADGRTATATDLFEASFFGEG